MRAEFKQKIHITVKNRHDGGQLKVDTETYNSGAEFNFWKNSKHDFESWEQTYGGFDMKFKDGVKWEMTEKTYNTALVQNHEVTTPGIYRAMLYQQYHYTADNDFLDGGSGGTIIINGETKSIPAAGNTLEEDPFTVEAPQQTQTVNGRSINYNFIEWENGSTNNPRSMNPDNHFEIKATYKGNMVSTTSRATGYNNGRRMVWDNNGKLHLVYEDNGEIWYTYSTNEGATWHKETRLSDGNGYSHSPSIAIGSSNKYHVVWEEKIPNFQNNIVYKNQGAEANEVGQTTLTNAYPVITANEMNDFVMIVWNNGSALKYMVITNVLGESNVQTVPNTNGSCILPSIANDGSSSYGTHLAWQKNNDIYYQNFHYSISGNNYNFYWRHYKCVSDVQSLNENSHPSISVRRADRKPVLVWDSFDASKEEYDKIIVYRKKSSTANSNWGTVSEFYTTNYSEHIFPSVTTYLNEDYNDATIAWMADNTHLLMVNKRDGQWESIDNISSNGRYPNLSVLSNQAGAQSDDNYINYTKYTSSPYLIKEQPAENGGSLGKVSSQPILFSERSQIWPIKVFLEKDVSQPDRMGYIELTVKAEQNERPVEFILVNDSLLNIPFFRTNTFGLQGNAHIEYRLALKDADIKLIQQYKSYFPNKLIELTLNNEASNSYVESLDVITIDDLLEMLSNDEQIRERTISFSPMRYPENRVYFDLVSYDGAIYSVSPERIASYYANEEGNIVINKQAVTTLPEIKNYDLKNAYPNPFNPTTEICFDLPRAGYVNLNVYDIKGSVVAKLVNGFRSKGRYVVTFDGSNLASGVYIYRLQANDFTAVKRMLLVK